MNATRIFILSFALLTTACTGLSGEDRRQGVSSSLVDFLYPGGEKPPPPSRQIPSLELPLKVGLAFVPSQQGNTKRLSEAERMKLLNDVKAAFAGRDFIQEIAVIPEAQMRTGRGFTALEQAARIYDLDVMALVSSDQVSNTSETVSSLLYWTLVGAYQIDGGENSVQTFVETAVFDVATRKLLFRAPGASKVSSGSTLVNTDQELRVDERYGFEQAMFDMTANLDKELASFKERIRWDGSVRVTGPEG